MLLDLKKCIALIYGTQFRETEQCYVGTFEKPIEGLYLSIFLSFLCDLVLSRMLGLTQKFFQKIVHFLILIASLWYMFTCRCLSLMISPLNVNVTANA